MYPKGVAHLVAVKEEGVMGVVKVVGEREEVAVDECEEKEEVAIIQMTTMLIMITKTI